MIFCEKATMTGLEARRENSAGANLLWVEPEHPRLGRATGARWWACGLPASGSDLHLSDAEEIKIGTVRPFEVVNTTAWNVIGSPRQLQVRFTKDLAKEVTAENIARWVRVEPAPRKLQATVLDVAARSRVHRQRI